MLLYRKLLLMTFGTTLVLLKLAGSTVGTDTDFKKKGNHVELQSYDLAGKTELFFSFSLGRMCEIKILGLQANCESNNICLFYKKL